MNTQLLQLVFMELVQRIRLCSIPSKWKRDFRIIHSTTILLCVETYKWATFRETKAGVKLYFRLAFVSSKYVYPEAVQMTTARSHDRTKLDDLINQSGITYVFDRGLVDYAKFDEYCKQGIFIVTRTKKNASIQYLYARSIPENSGITRDCFVEMGAM
ncbi:transposase [Brevibacillus fortis]|uniref:transposase n=1 Tax=Brevibacillus fortis TaxID=2126352 RepID=UPI0038FCF973